MNWRRLEVEIVTHCICAGADQQQAEIRVPSIRGQVRWWFRALGGGKEEEKLLFGGVHGNAERSKVIFRVEKPTLQPLVHNLHDLVGKDPNDPRAYLLWPLRPTRLSEQKRGMLPPGAAFTLNYAVRQNSLSDDLGRKLQAAVESWLFLGALGTRGRRGFGSLILHEAAGTEESLDSFRQKICDLLVKFGHPAIKVMTLSSPFDAPIEALRFLGDWLKEWRSGSRKSTPNPRRWGRNDHDAALKKSGTLYRPAVGLPITQRYGNGLTVESSPQDGDRWASPVHLKVLKWGGRFYPLAVFFPKMAIPEGSKVKLAARREHTSWELPVDHGLLKEMMKPIGEAIVLWQPLE